MVKPYCNAGWLGDRRLARPRRPSTPRTTPASMCTCGWTRRALATRAKLTAWELGQHGVAHTVIADNTGGHLMQHGMVDMCIVGTDRTTRTGDVANKIGTYLKALAAHDNRVPFYVALPSSSIDWLVTACANSHRGARLRGGKIARPHRRKRRNRTTPNSRRPARRQLRLRHHPRPPRHRPHHRARRLGANREAIRVSFSAV